ncbi:MAG: TonB-dependent receptor [Bacteroidales bacterium]|nr:TonB-dependent receptor [Bacteroidales bacterium]
MHSLKLVLVIISFLFGQTLIAQNGFIRGTVFDETTGETLPGVTVLVEGTTNGTTTDFDGKFGLSCTPGLYNLRISFISYETILLKDIEVKPTEATILNNLQLKEAKIELAAVTVTHRVVKNTEASLMTLKHKSGTLVDGISAANFRKIGDTDAASSMKRITGVSVEDGKYIFVRGLGDRYTKTILNGVDIPGLDPDRNTLQMDLFPTNVIDNIVVHKTFSAELPADFTGGVVDIETKDFPEEKSGNISVSMGYNPNMHFNNQYLTYKGGSTDFLGFDDGTRAIPACTNIPLFSEVIGNPNGTKAQRYKEILSNFNPTMGTTQQNSFMNYGFGISYGNQYAKGNKTWGVNAAFAYKNNTEFFENAEEGKYEVIQGDATGKLETTESQIGNYGVNNVLISGLLGIALKTEKAKYRINILHLQNGESKAGVFNYDKANDGTIFGGKQHNLEYNQRSLTNLLINGKHFSESWEVNWKIAPTLSVSNNPDIRFTRYKIEDNNYIIGTESGFPERIWRKLQEVNLASTVLATKEFDFNGSKSKLRFGGAYTYKSRNYSILNYAINIRNVQLTGNPDEIFSPENLWPMNGSITEGTTYEVPFIPRNTNKFDANSYNAATFISWEFSPFSKLKAIMGVRAEKYVQRYTGENQLGTIQLNNDEVVNKLDFFPTINLIYAITEKQNIRFSFSQTIARPSFKELSYAEIFDPISGRTFIGGLFRDANDLAGIEYWNGNLRSSNITNLDLRWELFQKNGQTISLGAFYKDFKNPIEIVQFSTMPGAYQPRNVGDGQVLGSEIELRQSLEFISASLKNINISTNVTVSQSKIKMSNTEYESRVAYAIQGQSIDKYREMAGQAPYIINAGIAYDGGERGIWKNLEFGLYYNVQGRTLLYVGLADRPDIYTQPFHSLNFNLNKNLGKDNKVQVGIKIDNILNSARESVFDSFNAEDKPFSKRSSGLTYQLKLTYKI